MEHNVKENEIFTLFLRKKKLKNITGIFIILIHKDDIS